jgi:thiamine-phosphate pyrophosphorylase
MLRHRIQQYLSVYLVMGLDGNGGRSALETAAAALEGGITMLQLREKNAPLSRILDEGRQIRELCRRYHVPFLVNDRVDVALLLDADGVHVGQDDLPGTAARQLLGDQRIVGISAGTDEEAEKAMSEGADYLGVGSIYATRSKKDAGEPIGTSLISRIKAKWDVPVVGIGGIDQDNAAEVIGAGADGVAVISAIVGQNDPREAAARLRNAVLARK